ncbi:hypothetical protein EPUL_003757 [Erysiphe pulchra]|uniref:Uncharacterized protein n=1 Tax=Erysiphe pulchra TaxID=225359 RepID=A0A2S4PPW4_9PEZI|nr:hypothetical protein EPUL_003757 [Erysiphe pulchra]
MEPLYQIANTQPGSLSAVSPERVNAQKTPRIYNEATDSPRGKQHSERSVHEKVMALNKLTYQARHLERKTNDAALKRAMLGREEADCEMRRYREEARAFKKALEESKRRERIVGERLETVMENFGRSRESFENAKSAWDKEIRRARKESFKTQSAFLKAQDELKSCRMAVRAAKSDLEIEKARSSVREQEAFQTRFQLAQAQEEQSHLQKQLQLVEQERDVLRKIVEKKQIARAASEGCIPLPISNEDDEFASPKKRCLTVGPTAILRSAASEGELEELRMELNWEKQRACRAFDRIEFLETECRLQCCASRIMARAAIQTNEKICSDQVSLSDENNSLELQESSGNNLAPEVNPLSPCTSQVPSDRSFARTPSCDPPESIHDLYKPGTPPPCSDTLEELGPG